jgi:cardiolipin synthase
MVSAKSDIPVTPDVVEYYSDKFRKMGATIHVFTDGFHHSKAMMIDDKFIYMGSANLNGRSLRFDYECNLLIVDSAATRALQTI